MHHPYAAHAPLTFAYHICTPYQYSILLHISLLMKSASSCRKYSAFAICCGVAFRAAELTPLSRSCPYIWTCISCYLLIVFRACIQNRFTIPAIAHHTDASTLGHAIEFSALLEIFLAANSLSITKSSFCKSITVTPSYIG